MNKSRFPIFSVLGVLLLAAGFTASASTLSPTGTSLPPTFNLVAIGDNGNQLVTQTMTRNGLLNLYNLNTNTTDVFNYTIAYQPTSAAFAEVRVWSGSVDPNTGWSQGDFLAQPGPVGTNPATPITMSGSFSMVAGTTYGLIAGLYDGANAPNGSYNLSWNVSATPAFSSAAEVVPVPEPETYAMLLAGLGLIGVVARRRKSDKCVNS